MTSRTCLAALFATALISSGAASAQIVKKFPGLPGSTVPAPTPPAPLPAPDRYYKGPNPTAASLEVAGSFQTQVIDLPARAGFAGGRAWIPVDAGRYGVVAISPGYTASASQLYSWGQRISSHGFVVIVIETLTPVDSPEQRAAQLRNALSSAYLTTSMAPEPLAQRADKGRYAVMGHSMGGGAALLVAAGNASTMKAAIAMAPWSRAGSESAFGAINVPTMTFGCQADTVAPVAQHAALFHDTIPATASKSYAEVRGGDHLCVTGSGGHEATLGKFAIAWLKRFVDNDLRYSPFLCGTPYAETVASGEISASRNTCPY